MLHNMLSVRLNFAYSPPKTIVVDSNESVSQFVQAVRRQPDVERYPMVSITCNFLDLEILINLFLVKKKTLSSKEPILKLKSILIIDI